MARVRSCQSSLNSRNSSSEAVPDTGFGHHFGHLRGKRDALGVIVDFRRRAGIAAAQGERAVDIAVESQQVAAGKTAVHPDAAEALLGGRTGQQGGDGGNNAGLPSSRPSRIRTSIPPRSGTSSPYNAFKPRQTIRYAPATVGQECPASRTAST